MHQNQQNIIHQKLQLVRNDPQYHRTYLLKSPLYQPQVDIINLVESHIEKRSGETLCILSARQTTKNEAAAEIQKRALIRYAKKGGIYIRTAPTYRPQVVISKRRLEKTLRNDPLVRRRFKKEEGWIFRVGEAEVHFLSSGPDANVVGDTASLCLDCDEAHKVDAAKFEEDLDPMRAFNNVPCVFWGVAADGTDLLWTQYEYNKHHKPENNLFFPAPIWCELRPEYATFFEGRVNRWGWKHPVIQTQYMLQPSGSADRFLDEEQAQSILAGGYPRARSPLSFGYHVITIDIGGEDTFADEVAINAGADPRKDSTAIIIWNIDPRKTYHGYPMARIVDIVHWRGKPLPQQQDDLVGIIAHWRPRGVIIDARGIGEQLGTYLWQKFGNVRKYKATSKTVNTDCNNTYAWVNNGRVQMFQDDGSSEYQEFVKHLRWAKKEVWSHDQLRMVKRSWDAHIDFAKSLSYMPRLVPSRAVIKVPA